MAARIDIDPGLVEQYLAEFAKFGAHGETGVWRTLYSPAWVEAADQYAAWCDAAGLAVHRDAVGNVWGRLDGTDGGKAIVSGSHIDSTTPGGRFDGALGALGGLIAVRALREQFGRPRRPLEAVALCEEESSRFRANFWGSRAVVGRIAPGDPVSIVGFDGVTIADAMRAVGFDPSRCAEARRDDIDAFVELHIEQGPVLEQAGLPVAIVTGITAIRGTLVEIEGVANHAGAFPMHLRCDPMEAFAEIVTGAIDEAKRMGEAAVTTIGRVAVEPNLPTAIPGSVQFTIDARHADADGCRKLCDAHDALIESVAARRGLGVTRQTTSQHAACACDPDIIAALTVGAAENGVRAMQMPSGAAHDAQQMASIARVGMVFVRSRDGRSHTPEEFSSNEDMAAGITVLAAALHRLAY